MPRILTGFILFHFHTLLLAQATTDSLQKILKRTEAKISFYYEQPKSFSTLAAMSIYKDLEILKSVYAYKNENKGYHKKVASLDSTFGRLLVLNPVKIIPPDTQNLAIQIEKLFKRREAEIIGLKIENQTLRKQNYLLRMDTVRLCQKYRNVKENELRWKTENKNLIQKLKLYEHGTYWGLSLGFNYFFNNPPSYYLKPDSTIGILGSPNGISFLISGIIGYKFHDRHSFIFNLPLGDFTTNSATAIGLFNQKLAGGLGYGYHISGVSIIAIINISPFQKIAPELLEGKKIEGDIYSRIEANDYPTTTAYSPSFTIGMSYNFIRKPLLNTNLPE